MPDAVKKYLRAVAELQGVDPADLSDAVEGALDQPGVAPEWMLSSASADSKLELVVATSDDRWICSRCARVHLHHWEGSARQLAAIVRSA